MNLDHNLGLDDHSNEVSLLTSPEKLVDRSPLAEPSSETMDLYQQYLGMCDDDDFEIGSDFNLENYVKVDIEDKSSEIDVPAPKKMSKTINIK